MLGDEGRPTLQFVSGSQHRTERSKVHTRFLAELLNPSGVHGQGRKFIAFFSRQGGKVGYVLPRRGQQTATGELLMKRQSTHRTGLTSSSGAEDL